eukprot:COSAG06_NODE_12844_length_1321_cov_2.236498_4_plen_65_part_00
MRWYNLLPDFDFEILAFPCKSADETVVRQHFNTANRDALEWVASDLSCKCYPSPLFAPLALNRL